MTILNMIKKQKNEKGFSLIELMIVVAIIGILAAIAVPTFTGFQIRARGAEGKNALGAFYTAQAAYYAERGVYGTLTQVGYDHPADGNYAVGFAGDLSGNSANSTAVTVCALASADTGTAVSSTAPAKFFLVGAVKSAVTGIPDVQNYQMKLDRKIEDISANACAW